MNVVKDEILVGLDGSTNSIRALDWAIEEAGARRWGLHLLLMVPSTMNADPTIGARYAQAAHSDAEDVLRAGESRAEVGSVSVRSSTRFGDPIPALVHHSADASLAVVGKRGSGSLMSRLMGSVSSGLAAHSLCPTIVIPEPRDTNESDAGWLRDPLAGPGGDGSFDHLSFEGHIVVALESALPTPALWKAAEMAQAHSAPLVLVSVLAGSFGDLGWSPSAEALDPAYLAEVARLRNVRSAVVSRLPSIEVTQFVLVGTAIDILEAITHTAAILVMGTRGLGGLPGVLMGSVSQGVLQRAFSPVMVVPAAHASL